MPNVVGFEVREDAGGTGRGPLHAVEGDVGRAAQQTHEPVPALCGALVRVVGAEEVPDDAGLCQACQYGPA
ncbi:hypothetical protein [Modestobacter sp. URMC 112]